MHLTGTRHRSALRNSALLSDARFVCLSLSSLCLSVALSLCLFLLLSLSLSRSHADRTITSHVPRPAVARTGHPIQRLVDSAVLAAQRRRDACKARRANLVAARLARRANAAQAGATADVAADAAVGTVAANADARTSWSQGKHHR